MSDHPKPNRGDKRKDERRKNTQKRTPAPSAQRSRSTTPVPSNRRGLSPGATGILPSSPKSAPGDVDKGADSLKGDDTAKTDKSDTAQFTSVGPTDGHSTTIYMPVSGGTGGPGGRGRLHGGPGGLGEGPNIKITNSNVYLTDADETRLRSIKEKLANHFAARHKSTDQSKSLCAPNTRVKIQADILKWLSPQTGTKEHIFWITGVAGSGKSTLSATVVDKLRKQGTPIAAQFFISRNIPETIDPPKIIPTIAEQLAESSPAAARIIDEELKNGFPPSRKEQVEALLLAPIRELSKSRDIVIILIDALDELQNAAKSVPEILSLIAPKDCDLPDNVRFLVTSRPEHWTDISRSDTLELKVFKQDMLTAKSSVDEVNMFIAARMDKITPCDWKPWPPCGELQRLFNRADGLFHYAATALHWIEAQIDKHGRTCQGWVLKNLTLDGGLGQLEDLYRVILISFEDIDKPAYNPERREIRLASFQHVIGTILVLREPLTISQIITLLDDIPVEHLDVEYFLQQMRSVLIPGTTTSFEEATPQMHRSFRDYIMDLHAPAEFHILTAHAHFVTARSCLEVIVKAVSQSDAVVEYSVEHWYQHLRKAAEGGTTWEDERMWSLFGLMVKKAIVNIWKANSLQVFVDVAAVGWVLLRQGIDKHRMDGISSIVMKAKKEFRRRHLEDQREDLLLELDDERLRELVHVRRQSLEEVEELSRRLEREDLGEDEFFFKHFLFREFRRRAADEEEAIRYQAIWDHGLPKTWDFNQSILSVSDHSNVDVVHMHDAKEVFTLRAKALYAYKGSPEDPHELSFSKGEIIEIMDQSGKWWQARKANGALGIVPSNYLTMI